MIRKIVKNLYLSIILLFTYIPILVMIVLSFNSSKSRNSFKSFTLDWYKKMFTDRDVVSALYNTVSLALISSVIAVIICANCSYNF